MKKLKLLFMMLLCFFVSYGQAIDTTTPKIDSSSKVNNTEIDKPKTLQSTQKIEQNFSSAKVPKEYTFVAQIGFPLLLVVVMIFIFREYRAMKKRQRKKIIQKKLSIKDFEAESINKIKSNQWFVLAESVIGKSHVQTNTPCQDNCIHLPLQNNWGIAIVCDGAGSAKNSQIGSELIAKDAAPRFFKDLVEREGWSKNNKLPNPNEWEKLAKKELEKCLTELQLLADKKEIALSSLACTIIVVIYSPIGLLTTHIGDGRAGYKLVDGTWEAAITPHKGEEANQTIFLTSNGWLGNKTLQLSGVNVPECRVINEPVEAFVLMSDGCENHSFECSHFDKGKQKWSDPNKPYEKFFNPLVDQMHKMATSNETDLGLNKKWAAFLESGLEGLKNEPDDKTMILGMNF